MLSEVWWFWQGVESAEGLECNAQDQPKKYDMDHRQNENSASQSPLLGNAMTK